MDRGARQATGHRVTENQTQVKQLSAHAPLLSSQFFTFRKMRDLKKSICLFLAVLHVCCCVWASSSCKKTGILFVAMSGLLISMSYCRAWALRCVGFSSCHRQAKLLQHTGLVPLNHAGSSQTRDQTMYPACIGRWILNHWITSESLGVFDDCFTSFFLSSGIYIV